MRELILLHLFFVFKIQSDTIYGQCETVKRYQMLKGQDIVFFVLKS